MRDNADQQERDDLALCLPLLGIAFILSAAGLLGLLYSEGIIGGSDSDPYSGSYHGSRVSSEDPSAVAARKYGGENFPPPGPARLFLSVPICGIICASALSSLLFGPFFHFMFLASNDCLPLR